MEIHLPIPLPPGCNIKGQVLIAEYGDGSVHESFLYVDGADPELHFIGPTERVNNPQGLPETRIRFIDGLPSNYYLG